MLKAGNGKYPCLDCGYQTVPTKYFEMSKEAQKHFHKGLRFLQKGLHQGIVNLFHFTLFSRPGIDVVLQGWHISIRLLILLSISETLFDPHLFPGFDRNCTKNNTDR